MADNKKNTDNKFAKNMNKILKNIKKIFGMVGEEFKKIFSLKITKCVLGIFAFVLVILFIGSIFKSDEVAYPVIYNNSDGDLYLIDPKTKDDGNAIKLASAESVSNVKYANTTDRYIIFQKSQALYLYDKKSKDETTKIIDDVVRFTFTEDDKYILALDEDKNLKVYDYKKETKIESDVSEIIDMKKDVIVYVKEKNVYVRSINPKKDDRNKVVDQNYSNMKLSEDGKSIIYITKDRDLMLYNIKKDKAEKISKNVSNYYCDEKSCKNMFYIEDNDTKKVFYYNGKDKTELAKDIYLVNAYDVAKKEVVYQKADNSEYTLYYQKVGGEEVKIEGKLTGVRSARIFDGKGIYYVNGKNEVKYVEIKGAKLGKVKKIAEDVPGYLYLHKKGYAFVGDVKDGSKGTLYIAKDGKAKKIDEDVNSSIIMVSNSGKKLYYFKDYTNSGDLYYTSGGKGKKIDEDVYTFEYVKDNLIYYIKDYNTSKSRGDLYRYTGKSSKIADNVTRIASSPVFFKLK